MEVRSDSGVIPGREPFGGGGSAVPAFPMAAQRASAVHNMRLAFSPDSAAMYQPISSPAAASHPAAGATMSSGDGLPASAAHHGLSINVGEPIRRKRGRPRKYGPDGTMNIASAPSAVSPTLPQLGFGVFSPGSMGTAIATESGKKKARLSGSSKKHQPDSLGTAGIGFTPHVITVKAGEDVSSKIMTFSQNGPRTVCVLSANGAISNVTLRQAATSGGTVTYEGRFEILSLSGSYMLSESGGQRSRTGWLSVSLAGPDGRVLGGGVAGLLIAASPVQVVVGSFMADGRREPKYTPSEPGSAPGLLPGGAAGGNSPPSRQSESSRCPGSPPNQSNGSLPPGPARHALEAIAWK